MGDMPTGVVNDTLATEILSIGQTAIEIRDEIYCQICKQINNNPRKTSSQRGLELLGVSFLFFNQMCQDFLTCKRCVCYRCLQALSWHHT